MAAARAGDPDAFAILYNEHHDRVFSYVVGRTRNRQLAEDLTQDVFVRALRRLETFSDHGHEIGAWLYTIARNIVIDHYKASRTRHEVPTGDMADEDRFVTTAEAGALRHLDIVEARETIKVAMRSLTADQRACVLARFFDELEIDEAAVVLGRKPGAVKTLQYRAVEKLREALAHEAVAA
ncbi:RNA polymerase sigma factor [Streptomyces sp. BH034]|uniref:RNA polymerase sigma factor n=1 Tax=Streptomyces sp. BH034 TaxID=3402626 RepID=UPI003BB6C4E0